MRLDLYLSQKLGISRNKAQFFIKQGRIEVNGKIVKKSSYIVSELDIVKEYVEDINYVSRSALKLKWFLEDKDLVVKDFICLDVGSSTGGFSQVLLEKGAKKVYSVDVGSCQLHPILKNNPNVVSIENTDIRNLKKDFIKENLDLIVCDVSFISLRLVIDSIISLMNKKTLVLLLFKPQFEIGSQNLTKRGLPKSNRKVQEEIKNFLLFLSKKGVKLLLTCDSNLAGEKGNKETFILFSSG